MDSEQRRKKAWDKYRDAILACKSMDYINCNVSQVARMFGLDGTALANFMRVHTPQILDWRERVRRWLGVNDNTPRGLLPKYQAQYAEAVHLYATTDWSIAQIAEACGVSEGGLSQHLRFYHHELLRHKLEARKAACGKQPKRYGELSGNGRCYKPLPKTVEKYIDALSLCQNTNLTIREIARRTSVSVSGLCNYLHKWHRELVLERLGISGEVDDECDLRSLRCRMKIVAAKYSEAITSLRQQPRPVAQVAADFGLTPDVFRIYLQKHEPDLARQQGMVQLDNGHSVLRRSREKYAEAIRQYASSTESLKSIANRMGLIYNSLSSYVRRNHPEVAAFHRLLLQQSLGQKPQTLDCPASSLIRSDCL